MILHNPLFVRVKVLAWDRWYGGNEAKYGYFGARGDQVVGDRGWVYTAHGVVRHVPETGNGETKQAREEQETRGCVGKFGGGQKVRVYRGWGVFESILSF